MKNGEKARLAELERRNCAALAMGHAVLDCPKEVQTEVCDTVLGERIKPHSRLDVMLAMGDQQIATRKFAQELDRTLAVEEERVRRAQENARTAREELGKRRLLEQNEEEFLRWLGKKGKPNGMTSAVLHSAPKQEEQNDDD